MGKLMTHCPQCGEPILIAVRKPHSEQWNKLCTKCYWVSPSYFESEQETERKACGPSAERME